MSLNWNETVAAYDTTLPFVYFLILKNYEITYMWHSGGRERGITKKLYWLNNKCYHNLPVKIQEHLYFRNLCYYATLQKWWHLSRVSLVDHSEHC